jgi:hypothetical protein
MPVTISEPKMATRAAPVASSAPEPSDAVAFAVAVVVWPLDEDTSPARSKAVAGGTLHRRGEKAIEVRLQANAFYRCVMTYNWGAKCQMPAGSDSMRRDERIDTKQLSVPYRAVKPSASGAPTRRNRSVSPPPSPRPGAKRLAVAATVADRVLGVARHRSRPGLGSGRSERQRRQGLGAVPALMRQR